jgi:hypothetical protein
MHMHMRIGAAPLKVRRIDGGGGAASIEGTGAIPDGAAPQLGNRNLAGAAMRMPTSDH